MGKILIIVGGIIVLAGLIIQFSGRIPFLGKLPGDLSIDRGNVKVFFPITTCIVISIVVSILLYLIQRFKNS
jgi:hypothetical protein